MENPLMVKVTNGSDLDIADRYNGEVYRIPARGSLNLPYAAACHIFGVNFAPDVGEWSREEIYEHLTKRWGWNRVDSMEKGKELFAKITFDLVEMEQKEKIVKRDTLAEARTPKIPHAAGFTKAPVSTGGEAA